MRLFRRRAGRHAAPRPEPDTGVLTRPVAPPSAGTAATAGAAGTARERIAPPPTGSVQPYGQVRLGFSDGSAMMLSPDDPRVRAFRALARELGRRDPR